MLASVEKVEKGGDSNKVEGFVYVVIPTFNRIAHTRNCIQALQAQTYKAISIIISDGGSMDGTQTELIKEFPDIVVLTSKKELWWAGCMAAGIKYALTQGDHKSDFLLMMNDDTGFDIDYISTLVRISRERNAAVGSLTVDYNYRKTILDAGEFIDWEHYAFPVKTSIGPEEKYCDTVDVLPGRGTIVPLHMIQAIGNVNAKKFPHYIADYEFFTRLKRRQFCLMVTYETKIYSHKEMTGLTYEQEINYSLRQRIRLLFSRRSMSNVIDHYRFIDECAPRNLRRKLKRGMFLAPIKRRLPWLICGLFWLFPLRYINEEDCKNYGLLVDKLVSEGIVRRDVFQSNRFIFSIHKNKVIAHGTDTAALYDYSKKSGKVLSVYELLRSSLIKKQA